MIDYNITPEPELDVGISTNEITFGIAPAGATGLSAYEIWLKHGNQGTEQEFLESLQAVPGTTNYNLLENRPSIQSIELIGNRTFEELGIIPISQEEIVNIL